MHPALIAAAAAAAFAIILVARALSAPRAAPPASLGAEALGAVAGVEERLASIIRVATVASFAEEEEDGQAFDRLKAVLRELYPLCFERMLVSEPSERSLLLEWPGRSGALKPIILCAHFDVVPPGPPESWERDPFSGAVDGGFVHGRGAQDIKVTLASALFAAEALLARGFIPERTVFFAFGGDEEVGGMRGAAVIAGALAERGVRASFLLDEGGIVADGLLSFVDRPLALIGISEKGYVDVAIEAEGTGGHASMPPRHTAAGVVAKAVSAAEARPFPATITYTTRGFLRALCAYAPFAYRLLFANLFVTAPLVKAAFSATPSTNALLRTTAAATMLSGSDKENVLPRKARAVLNVRILPGQSVAGTLSRLDAMAAKAGARAVVAHKGHVNDPLPESPTEHEGYEAVLAALSASFPEAGAVPFMFTAGTDTKHYRGVCDAIYRFAPILQNQDDLNRVHAANERVSVENVRRCALFYNALLSSC